MDSKEGQNVTVHEKHGEKALMRYSDVEDLQRMVNAQLQRIKSDNDDIVDIANMIRLQTARMLGICDQSKRNTPHLDNYLTLLDTMVFSIDRAEVAKRFKQYACRLSTLFPSANYEWLLTVYAQEHDDRLSDEVTAAAKPLPGRVGICGSNADRPANIVAGVESEVVESRSTSSISDFQTHRNHPVVCASAAPSVPKQLDMAALNEVDMDTGLTLTSRSSGLMVYDNVKCGSVVDLGVGQDFWDAFDSQEAVIVEKESDKDLETTKSAADGSSDGTSTVKLVGGKIVMKNLKAGSIVAMNDYPELWDGFDSQTSNPGADLVEQVNISPGNVAANIDVRKRETGDPGLPGTSMKMELLSLGASSHSADLPDGWDELEILENLPIAGCVSDENDFRIVGKNSLS